MHRKEGLMFKNLKAQHEEAAGMSLEDVFFDHHEQPCDCAVCDDIAFRKSLPAKCFVDNSGATDCDKLRQKVQAKHNANCLLRLLLETLPIQLEKHNLTHDRTACAMLIQDSIDYLFRDGEDTLIESPSNDEQQMLKMAYTMGQTTEQKLSEHLRKELEEANKSIEEYRGCVDKWRLWYDNASEDAKKWRRDAQELQGVVNEIRAELQSRAIHLLSKHCWCEPTGHSWIQKGTVAE